MDTSAALEAIHSIGVGRHSPSGWCCHGVGEHDHPADEQQPRLSGRRRGTGLRHGRSRKRRSTCAAGLDGRCRPGLAIGSAVGSTLVAHGIPTHGTRRIPDGSTPPAVAVRCRHPLDHGRAATLRSAGDGCELCILRSWVGAGLAETPGQYSVRHPLGHRNLRCSQRSVVPCSVSSRAISAFRGSPRLRDRPGVDCRGIRICCSGGHTPAGCS
jgi:hypothetical protein